MALCSSSSRRSRQLNGTILVAGATGRVGSAAVRLALEGVTDLMVVLNRDSDEPYSCTPGTAPLEAIANRQRRLPDDYIDPAGRGTTEAFRRYAMPLLGAPLPRHARLLP